MVTDGIVRSSSFSSWGRRARRASDSGRGRRLRGRDRDNCSSQFRQRGFIIVIIRSWPGKGGSTRSAAPRSSAGDHPAAARTANVEGATRTVPRERSLLGGGSGAKSQRLRHSPLNFTDGPAAHGLGGGNFG